jgi:hypothetical protein
VGRARAPGESRREQARASGESRWEQARASGESRREQARASGESRRACLDVCGRTHGSFAEALVEADPNLCVSVFEDPDRERGLARSLPKTAQTRRSGGPLCNRPDRFRKTAQTRCDTADRLCNEPATVR